MAREHIYREVLVALGKDKSAGSGLTIEDVRPTAEVVYDRVRKNCLRNQDWTFAEEPVKMEQLEEQPLFGFDNYYRLPADYLRVSYINGNNQFLHGWKGGWHIWGDKMAANFHPYLSYMRDVTDENEFPDHFETYFIHQLAAAICLSVTGDKELRSNLLKEAAFYKEESKTVEWVNFGDTDYLQAKNIEGSRVFQGQGQEPTLSEFPGQGESYR